jgi:hypothetical protein
MSTIPQTKPSLLWDYINHLPFKLFCAATVKHWANLDINLKVQQNFNTFKSLNIVVAEPNIKEEISRFKAKAINIP